MDLCSKHPTKEGKKEKKEDEALQAVPGCSPWHQLGAVQGPETFPTAKPFPQSPTSPTPRKKPVSTPQ